MGETKRKARRQGSILDISEDRSGTRWLVRVSLGGDDPSGKRRPRYNKVVHGPKRAAERVLIDYLKRKDDGLPVPLGRQTVGAWLDEWLKNWRAEVSARTRNDNRNHIRRYLTGPSAPLEGRALAARHLTEVTASDLQAFIRVLSERVAPRTVALAFATIRKALNDAMAVGKLAHNPAKAVKLPRPTHTERRALSPEEAQRFLAVATADPWHALFAVLIVTGLRPGEALALKWEDLDGTTLGVRRAFTEGDKGKRVEGSTKTQRTRSVPLPQLAVEALREHRTRQAALRLRHGAHYRDHGYIFATETGTPINARNLNQRHFKPLLKAAKLPPTIRPYDLRHTCATLLLAAG
ncbi:MAG TPA: tyrosine-type recombinase/integrase, partial [Gemmatimonadales bacterium]|nr:tyrosine-type recombinase/integrase [Gemmatimonadales bacterium]